MSNPFTSDTPAGSLLRAAYDRTAEGEETMPDDDQTTEDTLDDEQVDETTTDDTTADDQDEDADDTAGKDALLADLAKARKQRNTARTELEQARADLDVARTQLVDTLITREGYKPDGVRAAGLDDADLFDEDGQLDTTTALHTIRDAAGRLGLTKRGSNPDRGRDRTPPAGGSWQAALTGNK